MSQQVAMLWDYLRELDIHDWVLFSDMRSFSFRVVK